MSLGDKSASEISELLSHYGIKHGPVVESTRKLYEKKLEKAMEEEAAAQNSSDKTYYREEEVVTYITYHSPSRVEGSGDMLKHRGTSEQNQTNHAHEHHDRHHEAREPELQRQESPVQSSARKLDHSSAPPKAQEQQSKPGCMWRLTRLVLVLALLAAAGYVLHHIMSAEDSPELQ